MEKILNILRKNHSLPSGGPNDFQMNAGDQLIQTTQQEVQAMKILLIGSAIILLVAGGIGIINIMLASVTRRTREIGVRIAVGARRGDIRNQFLIEALLLSLAGGGLGMLGGLGIGFELMKIINGPFIVTSVTYVMPVAIALFIGIVFGLYPAIRAARLEPVVALQGSWA
jgi:ABC-type antimicrobial peptide transport system permease subunit